MSSPKEISDFINKSIDDAFRLQNYNVDFFKYFIDIKADKKHVNDLLNSGLGISIKYQIEELDIYLNGGPYYIFVKESYDWMGEKRITEFRQFLNNILEDAKKYAGKKRGRKPGSKRKAATADK